MFEKLPPKVLIVESDEIIRTSICNTIERYWFSVARADNSEAAIRLFKNNTPNVVIISSKIGTAEVVNLAASLQKLVDGAELPIIILLEENDSKDLYNSLTNPLAEFIKRPFTPNELMMCIKSLLRKSKPVFQDKVIRYKDLTMDLATYKVHRGDKRIHLGPTEFKIMQMLIQAPKVILSRQEIIDCVWGSNQQIEPRTVDVHVNRLRSLVKIRENELPFIKTVRAAGYCLNLPGERD